MPVSLKFLGVIAALGAGAGAAPLPALAQPDSARDVRSAEAAPVEQPQAERPAYPIRPIRLVVRDREVPRVDVPVKDAWTEDEGFQIRAAKVAYTRRF